jgi:hypothetical protein
VEIKKFTITAATPFFGTRSQNKSFLYDIFYPQPSTKMFINLIEIETEENTSDLILILQKKDEQNLLPFYLYKTEFILMKNKYCWNTKGKEEFIFDPRDFSIEVKGKVQSFSIDFYYSTDQKNPYILFKEGDTYRRY